MIQFWQFGNIGGFLLLRFFYLFNDGMCLYEWIFLLIRLLRLLLAHMMLDVYLVVGGVWLFFGTALLSLSFSLRVCVCAYRRSMCWTMTMLYVHVCICEDDTLTAIVFSLSALEFFPLCWQVTCSYTHKHAYIERLQNRAWSCSQFSILRARFGEKRTATKYLGGNNTKVYVDVIWKCQFDLFRITFIYGLNFRSQMTEKRFKIKMDILRLCASRSAEHLN